MDAAEAGQLEVVQFLVNYEVPFESLDNGKVGFTMDWWYLIMLTWLFLSPLKSSIAHFFLLNYDNH